MTGQPPVQRPEATDNAESVGGLVSRGGAPTDRSEPDHDDQPPVQRPVATDNTGSVAGKLMGGYPAAGATEPGEGTNGIIRQLGLPSAAGVSSAGQVPGGGIASSSSPLARPSRNITGSAPYRR